MADRITMTMDDTLAAAVRAAARRSGASVSAWLAEAAADKLRHELLGMALDRWEEEIGPPTPEELERAAEILGLSRQPKAKTKAAKSTKGNAA
jgi:hypothetical protein